MTQLRSSTRPPAPSRVARSASTTARDSCREQRLARSRLGVPPPRDDQIQRAGLVNRLRVARSADVVTVTAPPGYGKTTLVADWARRDGRPFAWYRIAEADDGASFVAHLAAAVSSATVGRRGALRSVVRRGTPEEGVAAIARALAQFESQVVVVLDDVDLLGDQAAIRALQLFVEELPAECQLVLVARAEPPLPLPRLRASRSLAEFGVDDLRLTDREAGALARAHGAHLPVADVLAMNRLAEGWPAGFSLGAARRGSAAGAAARGVRGILEYFRTDVLTDLAEDDIRFLTRASALDRLCGPLCDAVTGSIDSGERLERLDRSNLFVVPLDHERRWYRIHGIFRNALFRELEGREPGLAATLWHRAADWYAEHGDFGLAVDYAYTAGDVDQLASLIERDTVPLSGTRYRTRAEHWLEALDDEELLARHPIAAAIGAVTWAMLGRADDADRWAHAFDTGDLDPGVLDPARRAFVQSLIMRETPDDVRADAERAVSDPELDHSWRAPALLVLGGAYAIGGDRDAADAVLREAADLAAVACVPAIESAAVAYRSLLAAEVGAWSLADALAAQACGIVTDARLENDVTSLFAYAASSSAALRRGDWLTVHDALQQSERLLPGLTYAIGSFAVILRLEFARVWSALGDREHALELLAEMDAILARRPELEILRDDTVELREEIRVPGERESRSSTLTAAELRLLPLLTTHLSFREIADRLYVSRNTVKTQAISVYRKLGVSSRGEAVAHASRVGLVAGELHET